MATFTTPIRVKRQYAQRNTLLREIGYPSYARYLGSAHWKAKRAEYFASGLPQECVCGDWDVQLHHLTYERVGAELLTDLAPLCRRCHSLVHVLENRGEIRIDLEGLTDEDKAEVTRTWLAEQVEQAERERARELQEYRRRLLTMTFPARLLEALRIAEKRGTYQPAKREARQIGRLIQFGCRDSAMLTRRLRALEAKAYGWDDWADVPSP